ncbi:MAG: PH domain-containing protein [Nitrosopumilus sp.]|nr:PH domain-containing protein [Nitrosopumilus sp.]MDH3384831.1 PH domain-containing protein [Nitrosopumilus sp.]
MVKISITKTAIIINFESFKKFLALKNNLRIPLSCVKSVSTLPVKWLIFTPKAGTNFPGLIMAGTFFRKEGITFYYVKDLKKCITLSLKDHRYSKVVIQVKQKDDLALKIRRAVKEFSS